MFFAAENSGSKLLLDAYFQFKEEPTVTKKRQHDHLGVTRSFLSVDFAQVSESTAMATVSAEVGRAGVVPPSINERRY